MPNIRLISFTVTIPDEKQDKELAEKLQAEASGILNWGLEGLKMYWEDGLQIPHTISAATANYRQEADLINRFFDHVVYAARKRGPEPLNFRPPTNAGEMKREKPIK